MAWPSDQNQEGRGMGRVYMVLLFGPRAPSQKLYMANDPEEAMKIARRDNPHCSVGTWVERDVDTELESREIVVDALERARFDATMDVAKRRGRG